MKKNNYLVPFILVTFCFALWGFANDITNPMVKAFSKIFRMSVTDGALVQMAFYGGYFCMALPAAIFIRKYTGALCCRCPAVLPLEEHRTLRLFPDVVFHHDLWTVVPGDLL